MPLNEPRHSCPMFVRALEALDEAQSSIEVAKKEIENGRSINESLRDWGTSWQEHAEAMEKEKDLRIEELEKDLAAMTDRAGDAERERDELKAQLAAETDDIDKCGQDLG